MSTPFTLQKSNVPISEVVCLDSHFVNGEFITDEYNIGNFESLHLNVNYHTLDPDKEDENGNTRAVNYDLRAVIETLSEAGQWYPLAAQLSGHNGGGRAKNREIIIQPNMVNIDAGVENIVPGANDTELVRITREQGHLGAKLRVRLLKSDLQNGGLPFVSATISIHGILY